MRKSLFLLIVSLYHRVEQLIGSNPITKFSVFLIGMYLFVQAVTPKHTESKRPVVIKREVVITADEREATDLLCKEVKSWIDLNCPNHQVDVDYLVRACVANEFPVELCIAQGYLESKFGVAPNSEARRKKTYSLFGVGHWGNGVCKNYYKNWNASIVPYIERVQNGYIDDNQTYNDLINDEYVTCKGHYRYAGGKHYESSLRNIICRLDKESNIHKLAIRAQPQVEEIIPKEKSKLFKQVVSR